jgi:hypothetical protein
MTHRALPALSLSAAIALFALVYRPWHLRWGSSDTEVHEALPGDEIVAAPTFASTRAVTIAATPAAVWPWVVQLGFNRAGWYSYDLLDNLGRPSAVTINKSLQSVRIGDLVPLGPGGGGLYVKDLDPGRWLLWGDKAGYTTWLWILEPAGPQASRLLTRVRTHYRWTHPTILFSLLLVEPFDFPMMRKCLLGIKQRAETGLRPGEET